MLLGMAFSVVLVIATILIHYEALHFASTHLADLPVRRHLRILIVVLIAFAAHTVEVWLYGVAYWVLGEHLGVGALTSTHGPVGFPEYIYFSVVSFSTIGFGDIAPQGALRLIAGVEGLNGLLLIAWSASAAYFAMERYWKR